MSQFFPHRIMLPIHSPIPTISSQDAARLSDTVHMVGGRAPSDP
jgi:hypothetical protein